MNIPWKRSAPSSSSANRWAARSGRVLLEEENARLAAETEEMKRLLETRKAVERAKGLLQRRHNLSEEEAYLRMRNESRRLRRPMKELADAIILGGRVGAAGSAGSGSRRFELSSLLN